jgi:hypothetical protein
MKPRRPTSPTSSRFADSEGEHAPGNRAAVRTHQALEVQPPISSIAQRSRLISEPPEGPLACIVLPDGHDQVQGITVWEQQVKRHVFDLLDSG